MLVALVLVLEDIDIDHHHLANMELGHLLTRFGLTHLEVSLMVSPGCFCQSSCSLLVLSVICYRAFCLRVATNFFCILYFVQKWGHIESFLVFMFYNLLKCILLFFSIYLISAAVILLASLALIVHFSLMYNRAGRANVLCSFILVFFKVLV
jgi:hypothetical protein